MNVRDIYGTDLEVPHHDESHGVGEAAHQAARVGPTVLTVLYDLSIAQQTHHHHCTHTHQERSNTFAFFYFIFIFGQIGMINVILNLKKEI